MENVRIKEYILHTQNRNRTIRRTRQLLHNKETPTQREVVDKYAALLKRCKTFHLMCGSPGPPRSASVPLAPELGCGPCDVLPPSLTAASTGRVPAHQRGSQSGVHDFPRAPPRTYSENSTCNRIRIRREHSSLGRKA